jgi:hypothetical protein
MWQPNTAQWRIIWILAALIVLAWPPVEGKSLALKGAAWLVDPLHSLPTRPPELPMALGDDGFAVQQHDEQLTYYEDTYDSSAMNRFRMDVRDFEDPLDPTTERQLLAGLGVFGALLVWRLSARPRS